MPRIYVINKGNHNYTPAEHFGELVLLSEGNLNPFNIGRAMVSFLRELSKATDEDYLLPTSLGSLNALAGWILGSQGKSLNLLIFDKEGFYVERNLKFPKGEKDAEE